MISRSKSNGAKGLDSIRYGLLCMKNPLFPGPTSGRGFAFAGCSNSVSFSVEIAREKGPVAGTVCNSSAGMTGRTRC